MDVANLLGLGVCNTDSVISTTRLVSMTGCMGLVFGFTSIVSPRLGFAEEDGSGDVV